MSSRAGGDSGGRSLFFTHGEGLEPQSGSASSRRRRSLPTSDNLRAVTGRPAPRCSPPKSGTSGRATSRRGSPGEEEADDLQH